MRHYEVMVILDPDLEERAVSPLIENFLSVVREGNGKVEKVDTWGRRRLAYEIKKKPEGIYSVIDLQAEPAVVKELDRQMNLNESVLRPRSSAPRPTELRFSGNRDRVATAAQQQSPPRGSSMAGETVITVVGNLVDDPELRFTPRVRRSRSSVSRPLPAPSTSRPMSGRTARACS